MKKFQCDRCEEVCDPVEKTIIKFDGHPCEIEVCSVCYESFKKWAKLT